MGDKKDHLPFRCVSVGLLRATAHPQLPVPPWPDLSGCTPQHAVGQRVWLRDVWAVPEVADAIEQASPDLARQARAIAVADASPGGRQVWRAAKATTRYLLRMSGRATPFGLLAGVALVSFGPRLTFLPGDSHQAVVRADEAWLATVIARLESCPALRERLPVVANNTCLRRGRRLVVPYQAQPPGAGATAVAEVSIRYTRAVQLAVSSARSPVELGEIAAKLLAEFPDAGTDVIDGLLASLIEQRVLISSLRAPATVTDTVGHLVDQLEAVDAASIGDVADLLARLRDIRTRLGRHNEAAGRASREIRAGLADQMTAASVTERYPITIDLRLDGRLMLPAQVARRAEAALAVLATISAHPFGTSAWQDYHTRFFDRYGAGRLVSVLELVNADAGLGYPAGYQGGPPEPAMPLTARDERLLVLAQNAALDACHEVTLDDRLINDLAVQDGVSKRQLPPHAELCLEVRAASQAALDRGEFDLAVISVSRAAGTLVGRFVDMLAPSDQAEITEALATLPANEPGVLRAQLSFPPLDPATAHVTRVPAMLTAVIPIGEYPRACGKAINLDDLAVGCDGERLYLASLSEGRLVEPAMLHALELRAHTPPLARFLSEVSTAQATVITGFDWGAASRLPFLPRVRYGRIVLSPAIWRLNSPDMPRRQASWACWDDAFTAWSTHRRLPGSVCLVERDRRLRLDLSQAAHRVLIRSHLDTAGTAVLTDAPAPSDDGWIGGRAHEIVVLLAASSPRRSRPSVAVSSLTSTASVSARTGRVWLNAKLYGHPKRHPEIVGEFLPELLSEWDEPPLWWYVQYRDPRWHLRLRIALDCAGDLGTAVQRLSAWADHMRRLGLLNELLFAAYQPETGRWGAGPLMTAAEDVFAADSRALAAQFSAPARLQPQVLAAAHFVAIALGFTGSVRAAMNWLAGHANPAPAPPAARQVLTEAVRIADPCREWAVLRSEPGGQAITAAFGARQDALARYQVMSAQAPGPDPDAVLVSLLHAHYLRASAAGPEDERVCLRLARAAARSWLARHGESQ